MGSMQIVDLWLTDWANNKLLFYIFGIIVWHDAFWAAVRPLISLLCMTISKYVTFNVDQERDSSVYVASF